MITQVCILNQSARTLLHTTLNPIQVTYPRILDCFLDENPLLPLAYSLDANNAKDTLAGTPSRYLYRAQSE